MEDMTRMANADELLEIKRQKILSVEEKLSKLPQVDMEVTHHFGREVYGRELTLPADTIAIGKIHKHSSVNILATGEMTLLTEDGIKRIKAPYVVASKAGIKRAVYTHTECTWVSVHGTQETDLDKIEEDVIAKTYEEVQFLETSEGKSFLEAIGKEVAWLG